MEEILVTVHGYLRWPVVVVLLGGGAGALLQAPRDVAFRRRPFSIAVAVLDVQVLIGLVLYAVGGAWQEGLFIAVIHPVAMSAAAALAHVGIVRGAREAGERGHQIVGATFLAAFGLVVLGVPWPA